MVRTLRISHPALTGTKSAEELLDRAALLPAPLLSALLDVAGPLPERTDPEHYVACKGFKMAGRWFMLSLHDWTEFAAWVRSPEGRAWYAANPDMGG